LALLKPDVCVNEKSVVAIRELILANNFYFIESKQTKLSIGQAKQFYIAHESKQ
jgi:hypothetical protein